MSEDIEICSGELDQVKAIARHESKQREALQKHIETLNARIKQLENDFFRQAYCSALPSCVEHWEKRFLGTTGKSPSETTVAWAVELAEESVRQVGELNKEQARDS
jgi:polyhydroxyalkanoate synthesis regulator phasin